MSCSTRTISRNAAQPSPFLFFSLILFLLRKGLMVFNPSHTLFATSTRAAHAPSRYPHRSTVSSTGSPRISPPVCVLIDDDFFPLDAHNVCTRAKNHYDPQGQDLFTASSDVVSTDPSQEASGAGDEGSWVTGFRQTHELMDRKMYFC